MSWGLRWRSRQGGLRALDNRHDVPVASDQRRRAGKRVPVGGTAVGLLDLDGVPLPVPVLLSRLAEWGASHETSQIRALRTWP
jgi:hypothetical protein